MSYVYITKKVGTICTITAKCPTCGEFCDPFLVNEEDLKNWNEGMLIQKALPYLSKVQRECLVTGTCEACWKKIFEEPDFDKDIDQGEKEAHEVKVALEQLGFEHMDTGGNCTAFYKKGEGGSITLITDIDGSQIPTSWDDKICITYYTSEAEYDVGTVLAHDFPILRDFLK